MSMLLIQNITDNEYFMNYEYYYSLRVGQQLIKCFFLIIKNHDVSCDLVSSYIGLC